MLSKTEIANLALARLGVSLTITDLATDNSNQAKIIRRHFRSSFDHLLEKYRWNFAEQSRALVLHEENTTGIGPTYKYVVPTDALVIREIESEGIFSPVHLYADAIQNFEIVYAGSARYLTTEVVDAHAKFTARIDEDTAVPNYFGRALAAQLSMDVGPSLITNNWPKVKQAINAEAELAISEGIAADAGNQPQMQNSYNPFLRARL